VLDKATNLNSGLNITDTQSGFRAFAAHTASVFRFRSNGFGIESEMLMDATSAGLRIKEVEDSFLSDKEPHGATQIPELDNVINIFQPKPDIPMLKTCLQEAAA